MRDGCVRVNVSSCSPLHALWLTHFQTLEAELNSLDAATGDGDHGATMVRGLSAVLASEHPPAKAFRKAAGGASGSLFSILIGALEEVVHEPARLQNALHCAAEKINQIGGASTGDKTLLDALIPASGCESLAEAVAAARNGFEATVPMQAKRGRARYVEGAGVGHADAGARSVVELLSVMHEFVSSAKEQSDTDTDKDQDIDTAQRSLT